MSTPNTDHGEHRSLMYTAEPKILTMIPLKETGKAEQK